MFRKEMGAKAGQGALRPLRRSLIAGKYLTLDNMQRQAAMEDMCSFAWVLD